jgi:tetratricopeptide (TPR) repeat protein
VNKAIVLLALDRREAAWAASELALSIEPTNAKALANRGAMYNLSGDFERGLAASERAIAADPENTMAHLNKAQALLHLTDREREAVEAFAQLARLEPAMHEAHFGRARAHAALGQFEECRDELGTAIGIEPDDAEYHELLAVCLASLGQRAEADMERRLARQLRESAR